MLKCAANGDVSGALLPDSPDSCWSMLHVDPLHTRIHGRSVSQQDNDRGVREEAKKAVAVLSRRSGPDESADQSDDTPDGSHMVVPIGSQLDRSASTHFLCIFY